jgi:hypothetical protein
MSSIGLEIMPKSAFTAYTALLPSAEWSGAQHTSDSNGHLAHFFNFKRAKLSAEGSHTRPSKFKFKKGVPVIPDWMGITALWRHITVYHKGKRTPLRI